MPAQFRFAAKKVLLTYSDVCEEITREAIHFDLTERFPIITYVIAEETHPSTGGRHIHALLEFARRVDSVDARLFDVADSVHQHHPNIKPVKYGKSNWDKAADYVKKEDPAPLTNEDPKLDYGEIFEQAESVEDFLRLVLKNYPRDYALNYDRLESMARKRWPTFSASTVCAVPQPSAQRTPFELYTTDPQSVWNSRKSLIVVGPPGAGKTTWAVAQSPKPCLFVRHLDQLKELKPIHQSIVFDDLDFRHLPHHTQKFLVDMEMPASIHVRYAVATIPSGLPRIFTANEYPFERTGIHGRAIARRVKEVIILE